ncbi:MAG: hypothetical protein PHS63_08490 [Desulfoplanes sp.]|nr:hypothetical protein [Desulfoplanes sp.]
MKRTRKLIFWITGLCFFLYVSCAFGQKMHTVNTPFQICCVDDMTCADKLARELPTIIPGLQADVRKESCNDAAGRNISYYAVYVWHTDMTAEDICHALGERGCASCSKKEDRCPGKNEP